MISATDSFISYLADTLAGTPPVRWMRVTTGSADSHELKMDTLNVSILSFRGNGSSEDILISLDLLGSDERLVLQWAKDVRDALIELQYTPELDYEADSSAPPTLGRMVEWDGRDIEFSNVISQPHYFHLNATFPIRHVRA